MKSKGKPKLWKPVGGCVLCIRVCVIKDGNSEGGGGGLLRCATEVYHTGLKSRFNRYLQKTEGVVIWATRQLKWNCNRYQRYAHDIYRISGSIPLLTIVMSRCVGHPRLPSHASYLYGQLIDSRAATHDCFYYGLTCGLFSWLIA